MEFKLPENTLISRAKVLHYLLVPQKRSDKSAFLAIGGYTLENPEDLLGDLHQLRCTGTATMVDDNKFGCYYEMRGTLPGRSGVRLQVLTIWMTEHLSGLTKFVTLIPVSILRP